MKKALVCLTALLLFLSFIPLVFAENQVFAFEDAEYSVLVGKTIKPKTVAQGISGKMTYSWSSSDDSVATVKNGAVKGVSGGTATITCTATTTDGDVYTAECSVCVIVPIKSITVEEKSVVLAPSPFGHHYAEGNEEHCYVHRPTITITPADATIQTLEWSSSNNSIATVSKDGTICGQVAAGTATITGKATDGSGKKVQIKVTIPKCYVTEDNITITSPEGVTLGYVHALSSGSHYLGVKNKGGVVEIDHHLEDEDGLDMIRLIPVKAGTGSISFIHNGRSEKTVKIKVEHSAVYDKVSYPPVNVSALIASAENSIGVKTQVTCQVAKIEKAEHLHKKSSGLVYGIVVEKGERYYVVFEYDNAFGLEEGETYTIYGEVSQFIEYVTDTGLVYTCPYFINGHIN